MIRMRGSVRVNPRVRTLEQALTLSPRAMDQLTSRLDAEFRKAETALFDSEGASADGQPWAPWSEEYAARRDAAHEEAKAERRATRAAAKAFGIAPPRTAAPVKRILHLTGELRASFNRAGGDHVAQWYRSGNGFHVQLGSRNPKAKYADTAFGRRPRRDPRKQGDAQVAKYAAIVREFFRAYVAAGLRGLAVLRKGAR